MILRLAEKTRSAQSTMDKLVALVLHLTLEIRTQAADRNVSSTPTVLATWPASTNTAEILASEFVEPTHNVML